MFLSKDKQRFINKNELFKEYSKIITHGGNGIKKGSRRIVNGEKIYFICDHCQKESHRSFSGINMEDEKCLCSICKNKETKRIRYGDPNYNNEDKSKRTKLAKYGDDKPQDQKLAICYSKWEDRNKGESVMRKNRIKEQDNVEDIIKEFIETNWSDSDSKGKGVQLLKGIVYSDSEAAQEFIKDLDDLSDTMDASKYTSEKEESTITVNQDVKIGDYIVEAGDRIRILENKKDFQEKGPVGKEGALKFVFKLPKEGKFTAEFLDGSTVTIDVDPEDESSDSYAFVGKDGGKIFKAWNEKPSREQAYEVLQRVKSY